MKELSKILQDKYLIFDNSLHGLILYKNYKKNRDLYDLDFTIFLNMRYYIYHQQKIIQYLYRKMNTNIRNLKQKHTRGKYDICLKKIFYRDLRIKIISYLIK